MPATCSRLGGLIVATAVNEFDGKIFQPLIFHRWRRLRGCKLFNFICYLKIVKEWHTYRRTRFMPTVMIASAAKVTRKRVCVRWHSELIRK